MVATYARAYNGVAIAVVTAVVTAALVYIGTRHKLEYALVAAAAVPVALWVVRERGNGYFVAIVIALAIPFWYPHVWLAAPILLTLGLLAGVAWQRLRFVDLAVLGVCVWFTLSWLFSPQLGISTKLFVQGMLPFQFYFFTRLTLTANLLPRLRWVLLAATTVAALSVVLETVLHRVVFVSAQNYQWDGGSTQVFRPGGIFGGSPAAGIALATLLPASIALLRSDRYPRLVRAALLVIAFALLATYARSAYVAIAVALVLLAILLPYRRWLRVALGALALGIAAYTVATSPSTLNSLQGTKLVSSGIIRNYSNSQRLSLYSLALPLAADSTDHILFGRGFEALISTNGVHDAGLAGAPLLQTRGGPHNDYLRAILEQGILGLVLILCWTGGALYLGARTALRLPKGSEQRLLVAGLTAGVLAYAVASFFHDNQHNIIDLSVDALMTGLLVSVCSITEAASHRVAPARAANTAATEDPALPRVSAAM